MKQGEWLTGCEGGACLRIKDLGQAGIIVGDTTDGACVYITREEWNTFIEAAKAGKFD